MNECAPPSPSLPIIEKLRLETVRRNLTVVSTEPVTPRMLRITLTGDDLAGFNSPSPDDHLKIFLPSAEGELKGRDYTPRAFDAQARLLTIEFFLHAHGAGSDWARQARPGDSLQIGGPRGSTLISAPGAWWLLIGDETALPSVARRLEELAPATRVIGVFSVNDAGDEHAFRTAADYTGHWIHRAGASAADAAPLLDMLSLLELPPGPGMVWIAAEAGVSRAVRSLMIEQRKHPEAWIKASAYWTSTDETR